MRPLSSSIVLFSLAVAACGAPTTVASSPTPATTPSSAPMPSAPSSVTHIHAATYAEPARNWQLLDPATDHVPGIAAERAMNELLKGKAPKQTVLVAIIDNGIDTAHVDLKANLWTNPKDGTHGWNFIGGKNGDDVHFDTFEVTREYARCHNKAAASGAPAITDAARCAQIDADYAKQKDEITSNATAGRQIKQALDVILPILDSAAHTTALTTEIVRALQPANPRAAQARQMYLSMVEQGMNPTEVSSEIESIEGQLKYSINPDFNPRTIVGDNYANPSERDYGNRDVEGPEAIHGTHVAGIIGAVRGNGIGIDGVAPAVKFMMIRTVPDGDERDKDVANAIRFAADHGAQIISMSFGKSYSPYKQAVDDAIKYADAKGILMVHAAGNDGADLAKGRNFPTPNYLGGGHPANWIEVGASSWKGGDKLAAPFSNYNQQLVDVFAPGEDILSTVPGNQYQRLSGTSMAAPVVSGLAALIMDYYPSLTAGDVKKIIMASVTKLGDQQVQQPGDGGKVPFGTLSVTGGIVNAYNAIQMAEQISGGKPRP